MNRPGAFNYVIGNRASVVGVLALTAIVAVRWWTQDSFGDGHIPWFVPAFAAVASNASLKARGRVRSYAGWKKSWNAMSGVAEQPPSRRGAAIKVLVGTVTAIALFCYLHQHVGEEATPEFQGVSIAFAAVVLWGCWGALKALFRVPGWLLKRTKAPAKRARRAVAHVVTLCLGVPRSSPGPRQFMDALPPYCRGLLARPPARPQSAAAPQDAHAARK
jgi:hypothetical protein